MKDKIVLTGMAFYAYHGVHAAEQQLGQLFKVDIEASVDLSKAGETDLLEHTLNYADLYEETRYIMQEQTFRLIEAAAETIASTILHKFAQVSAICVRVHKPHPPISGHYDGVMVEIHRKR